MTLTPPTNERTNALRSSAVRWTRSRAFSATCNRERSSSIGIAWFQQPVGVERNDLSVKASYYTGYATFVLRNDRTGRRLAEVKGKLLKTLALPDSIGQNDVIPNYHIVRADGIVEIMEFTRKEPVFDMLDDPDVRSKLLTMTGNEALLK